MTHALTVKAIENLKPSAVRREIPDGEVRGLYLQIFPSGKASWAFRYRFGGRTRKLTIGPSPEISLKDARDLARKAHGTIAGGQDPAELKQARKASARIPVDRDLIEKVAAQFLQRHVKGLAPKTMREVTRMLAKDIIPVWRGRRLSQISKADVHELLDGIVDRAAPVQANRTHAWLKIMCNFAVQRGLVEVSPMAGIKAPGGQETPRDRILTDGELRALWDAADVLEQPYRGFVQLLILTGQRRGEVSGLTWGELDLDAKLWTLPAARAKNGVEHTIPLCDAVIAILRSIPRISGSDFVFSITGRSPIKGFGIVKRRLDELMPGMPAWVIHDIRRTAASGMARLGVNLPVIEKLLNHVSGSFGGIVSVYQRHDFAEPKRAAMATWANFVQALVSGESVGNVVELTKVRA
jgi:integrase